MSKPKQDWFTYYLDHAIDYQLKQSGGRANPVAIALLEVRNAYAASIAKPRRMVQPQGGGKSPTESPP